MADETSSGEKALLFTTMIDHEIIIEFDKSLANQITVVPEPQPGKPIRYVFKITNPDTAYFEYIEFKKGNSKAQPKLPITSSQDSVTLFFKKM
ncbi:MAG: hypothetical protein K2X35_11455 [Bryobacteraceae bacterium]|nr:hypothetical protein [Bryobacteraceae bacterium]